MSEFYNSVPPDIASIVRRMWLEEGASASAIKVALNLAGFKATRNSILGLVHRRGWKKAVVAPLSPSPSPPRSRRRYHFNKPLAPVVAPEEKMPPPPSSLVVPSSPVPFNETTDFQCHWVERSVHPSYDMPCCGASVTNGLGIPYCDAHVAAAYRRVPQRREVRPARRE